MGDPLRLLFELDVDSRSGSAGLLRFRKDIAATIDATRRAITQPLKSLNTTPIVAAAKASSALQEKEQRRLNSAVESLQRQRSAALIRAFKDEEKAAVASARAQERAAQQASRAITNAFRGIGSGLQSVGRTLTVGITAPLLALGAVSLKSAKDLDANVNTLKAFTGSAEAAERRLAQLIKTARGTPGLTTNLGLTLDAQLRTAKVVQETIDRVLPSIGRLNAVSKLPDVGRFTQNLVQLVTQNFEKQDLKELVGQSPLAGQLITEIFNVDSPTNAKAIREQAKKLGITSVDAFFNAFAEAAAKNQGLANVTESIGTRFDKIVDRVTVAFRPLGLAIINAIQPFIEPVASLIERVGKAFDSLSTPVKTAIIVIAGIAAAAGPVLLVLGSLATGIAAVVSAVGTVGAAVAAVGLPAIAAIIAGLVIVIGEWVVILGTLGLAWKTNFLGIRDLVSDAATAVTEAFSTVRTVINEATRQSLPTLQSITTKVVAAVTIVWERYGKAVVSIVGTAFRFITTVTAGFLRTFADFVDLILKLVDGNWAGAWSAFARIVIRGLQALEAALTKLPAILLTAFVKLNQIILDQAVKFAVAGEQLAVKFVASIAIKIVQSAPLIRDALLEMLTLAISGLNPTAIAAVFVGKFITALKKAAAEGIPKAAPDLSFGIDPGAVAIPKKRPSVDAGGGAGKGADAETRRRIRVLELEAEKAEAIAQQRIASENIFFEQRRTSLKAFTDFQIKEEETVLAKKKAVFAAERVEAGKLGKGRDLALKEIGLKELKADIEFFDKRNALLANQDREELEAAKTHRQALLDIQEQADDALLAELESFAERGFVSAADIARRRTEIVAASLARRKDELKQQLIEAGSNVEEQQRVNDELDKLNKAAAESVKEGERDKRRAIFETANAYRDYVLAIREALEATTEATRNAAALALDRLTSRALLTQQQRIKRQFDIDKSLLDAQVRGALLRIDNAEHEAIEKAKKAGSFGEEALKIEKTFNDLRLAEQRRFEQEKGELIERAKADLERADSNSTRSLFGDTFADFGEAIRTAAATAGAAISNLSVVLGSFGAAAAEHFANASASAGNFISVLLDGIDQINVGLGDMLANWILTGDAGSGALRKLLASTIAYYAKTFLIKAFDNVAEGFSNLAKASAAAASGNIPASILYQKAATENFISAAKYGLAAAGAAAVGRLAAGDSFKQKDTASRAVNGGADAEPRNRTFNSDGVVESSSQAARDGSAGRGGFFGGVIARIEGLQRQTLDLQRQQQLQNAQMAQTLTRFGTSRPGDVVTMGAPDAQQAIGVAVIDHSNSNADFNESMSRNLGFA